MMELGIVAFVALLIFMFDTLNSKFKKISGELAEIRKQMAEMLSRMQQAPVGQSSVEEQPQPETGLEEVQEPVAEPEPEPMPAEINTERETVEPEMPENPPVVAEVFTQPEEAEWQPEEVASWQEQEVEVEEPEVAVPPVTPAKKKEVDYEKYIGENLFGKIGILIFVIGVGFFVKYAIDKDWISESLRTVLGFLTGSVLLGVAERLRKRYRTFSSLLAGGAFAVFYLTVAIAYHYYELFSQTVAFGILVGVTLFMSVLAVLYDRRELAIISLVGGFLAPFLVTSGEDNYIALFTYVSILNVGMFILSIYKKWGELPVLSFVFTYLVMFIYVLDNFVLSAAGGPVQAHSMFWFATLFYFIFLLPVVSIFRVQGRRISKWLLNIVVINNFLYLVLGSMFLDVMELDVKLTGVLSLFIALVNLALTAWLRKKQGYRFLFFAALGLVLTFVSLTVPLQMSGDTITLFWASETVLLLWLYVKSRMRIYEVATFVLVCLTAVSFLIDAYYIATGYTEAGDAIYFNSTFATSLYTGLAAGAFALLMQRHREFFRTSRRLTYIPWNPAMLLISVALIYFTFIREFYLHLSVESAGKSLVLFTSLAVLAMAIGFRKRFPLEKYATSYAVGMGVGPLFLMWGIWWTDPAEMLSQPTVKWWLTFVVVIATLCYISRRYYKLQGNKSSFTVYISVMSTLLWLTMVRLFLYQSGYQDDFSSAFSISLSVAGFVQMALGMRLCQKALRMVSLGTFGIVLLKLVLMDLWAMPTIGKIIVFIILGILLLLQSFLYQKLKDVLFKDDKNEVD